MNIETLRLFAAACDGATLTSIAEQEHLSRQAVSQAIRALEMECGTALLTRSRTGSVPTPAGKLLLDHARTILKHHDAALSEIKAYITPSSLHIGIGEMTRMLWPWDLPERYAAAFSASPFTLQTGTPAVLEPQLHSGSLDALITNAPIMLRDFRRELIVFRPSYLLARRDTFSALPSAITPDHLKDLTLLLHPSNPFYNRKLIQYQKQNCPSLSLRSAVSTDIMGIMQEVLHDKKCVYASSGLYERLIALPQGLVLIPFAEMKPPFPSKNVFLIYSKSNPFVSQLHTLALWLKREAERQS